MFSSDWEGLEDAHPLTPVAAAVKTELKLDAFATARLIDLPKSICY
jgi:hypothetical protein